MAETKYVVFKLGAETYGLPIDTVERILPEQSVTPVPKVHRAFLGLFDLRGETVPALDLRTRFGFEKQTGTSNFIVIFTSWGRCSIRVDSVDGIVTLEDKDIEDKPSVFDRADEDDFVRGVGKYEEKLIIIVEPDNTVPKEVRKQLAKPSTAKEKAPVLKAA